MSNTRLDPRVSINKLGEYLTCGASRRRRILEDAKRPKAAIAPRFNDFYNIAPQYLASRPINVDIITNAINEIAQRGQGTDWDEQNKNLNTDLLTNLIDIPDLLDLQNIVLTPLPNSQAKLTVAGVEISVRPELLITGNVRGRDVVGALKLYVPKSSPLDQATADYITTMVHQFLTDTHQGGGEVDYQHCYVADVPTRAVFRAPRSYTRRRADVEAACRDIYALWSTV